ncbi:hypothetical protein Tco_0643515 [Tanacetum coccineum]
MAKQAEVNKRMCKGTGQRENRPVWNNVNRVNHQNQFVPTAVLTRTGKIQVNTARASSTNNVNTVRASSTKDVSTARHNFNSQAVPTNAARKVNTVKPIVNNLVLLGENGKLLLSPQQVVIGDPKGITGTKSPNTMDYPQRALKNKGIVDSGCSRHMTGNKAHLAEYQDYNGGPVAFGDYIETQDAHNEKGVSTEDQVNTVKPDEGTDKPKVSTDKIEEGTAKLKNGNSGENAKPTATPIVFGDDETIAEFLVSMSQNKAKQKGVEIKDAEDSNSPRPTSTRSLLTLKPFPKIDPKDKGKKVLEEEAESDAESEGVNEAERDDHQFYTYGYFHEIIDFLTRSSIHYALTVSLVVSTIFVEQFWMSAKSKIINNVRYITAKVAGKPVNISKASIRSDLLFDDVDGIDSLHNQAIFDVIQLMGITALVPKNQHETQPDPSPRPSPSIPIPDSILEGSGGNHGDQAKEIKHLKAQIKKLKKKAKPVITHHKAWMKSVSMKQRLAGKKSLKTKWMQKESVSKQGRKPAKAEPTVHKDPAFDDLDDIVDDAMDYIESEDAQDEGRTSSVVLEEKESTQKGVSTEVEVSTVKPDKGTDKSKVSTDKPEVSTAKPKDGTSDESTAPTTVFRDDETIAEFLVSMSQTKAKQKGVEIKDAEDSDRPRATSTRSVLTLKPLPKINPKDKGKKVLEEEAESDAESDAESEGVDEAERKRLLAKQRSEAIRKKPPSRNQLRNQMMTYLKHFGGKKHSNLKTKSFEEIQVLYEKIKRSDDSFNAIGSAKDEKVIKEMNEQAADASKKKVKKDDSVKGEIKEEKRTRKRKLGTRKKMKSKKRKFTSKDDEELRLCLTIAPDEDKEVDL